MSDHAAPSPGGVDQPREHSFDDIEEYDNDLPLWWLAMLYLSAVAAVIYVLHFHFGPGKFHGDPDFGIRHDVATTGYSEEQLRAFSKLPERVAHGKKLSAICMTCHGPDLTGFIGPNLRDDWWIYGSNMTDIVETITKGRTGKLGQMPSMDQQFHMGKDEIADLACYVVQLNREGPKENKLKPHDPSREKEVPIKY